MSRPLLYVAAPVRTATPEERALVRAVRLFAFELGWTPVWGPALLSGLGLTDEIDRAQLLESGLEAMRACQALVLVGKRVTEGMELELRGWLLWARPIYLAHKLGPPRLNQCDMVADYAAATRWSPHREGGMAAAIEGIKAELTWIGASA